MSQRDQAHLHAVSQDELINDEGYQVSACHLPRDHEVPAIVKDADLDHQEGQLKASKQPQISKDD